MAVLGKNTCTPARIYGPLGQSIFCGCSVISFSVQAGWNEQSSSVSVELVEDSCAGSRVWWDENLDRQSSANMADPGFTFPEPGVAAYFRMEEDPDGSTETARGGFEYCGIVAGWTQKNDANGNPVFTVNLVDPRVIIEKVQVIVNDFPGATSGVWNLLNAYGFVESLGATCTSSPAGAIGGVTSDNPIGNQANSRGMVWNDVKCAVHTLTSSSDQVLAKSLYTGYCRDNRIVYVGPDPSEDGYGIIKRDDVITDPAFQALPNVNLNIGHYLLDLTEIPFSPLYYRISGPNISLMEMISQVCSDAGCDYYVELLPVKNGSKVLKVIKVRIAVRSTQPQLGILDDFIAAKEAQAGQANGGVLSYTQGEEIRNEDTSTYLIGGAIREGFEAEASNMLPFWGVDIDGSLIQAAVVGGEYQVHMDLSRLNTTLFTPFAGQFHWITERELRAALSDIDSWKEVALLVNNDFATWLRLTKQVPNFRHDLVKKALEEPRPAHAWRVGLKDDHATDQSLTAPNAKDLDKVFEFVRSFADEFYGKQWLANATSFVCFTTDLESQKLRYSHEPSTEGCWINDGTSTVLGLTHDTAASDFFRDEVGKYQPIVKFPGIAAQRIGGGAFSFTADPSKLGDDNYITDGVDDIWVKADVDEQWVFGTPLAPASSTISFLLKTGSPITNRTSDTNNMIEPYGGLDIMLNGSGLVDVKINIIDRGNWLLGAVPFALAPSAALAPTWNHVQVYGPWGVVGLPGQVNLETDEGFVPWEYGSDNIMYQAALNKVASSVTQMRKGERGSITVAGFPNIPIGAELFSVDATSPPNSQGAQKYVGTRTFNTDLCAATLPYVHVPMNKWTGEFGPNVTSITVSVGPNGFTTQYQFSTYTPAFGRFNKDNAERLKNIGQTRLSNLRNLRAGQLLRRQVGASIARARQMLASQLARSDRSPKSAHHCYVGRYTAGDRPEINTQPVRELTLACQSDTIYSTVAVMSMDGLLRPVSKSGDGGLSPFAASSSDYCSGMPGKSRQSDPPIIEYTSLSVTRAYLDPLANPSESLPTDRSDTPLSGHDIEILGRNVAPPSGGWAIIEGDDGGEGYAVDYRFFALRGPLLIQQWGYDDCGKPIPNKADSVAGAEAGTFVSSSLEDKFLDSWLQKPKTWPMAPLDLRYDRERGVWTTPQPPRPLHVTPTGTCVISYPISTIENGKVVEDATGSTIADKTASISWPWTIQPPTGIGKIPVYYDNVDCEYYAFPANRLDVACSAGGQAEDTWYDIKRILFDCETGISSCGLSRLRFNITTALGGEDCQRDIFVGITGGGVGVSGHELDVSDLCNPAAGLETNSPFELLKFVGNLSVTTEDSCTALISGTPSLMTLSGTGVCGRDAVPQFTAGRIVASTGLLMTDRSTGGPDCDAILSSIISASGYSTKCSSGAPGVGPHTFECLIFGTGLQSTQDGCEWRVDGVVPEYSGVSGICSQLNTGVGPFQSLLTEIGSGILLTKQSECVVRLDTNLYITGRVTGCLSSPVTGFNYTELHLGSGLQLYQDGCAAFVSAPQFISGLHTCATGTGLAPIYEQVFSTIVMGSGLAFTGYGPPGGCKYRIDSTVTATGNDLPCGTQAVGIPGAFFKQLHFSTGITSEYDADCCIWKVTAPHTVAGSGACVTTTPTGQQFAHLVFSGSEVIETNAGTCEFTIQQIQRIRDVNRCPATGVGIPSTGAWKDFRYLTLGSGLSLEFKPSDAETPHDCHYELTAGIRIAEVVCNTGEIPTPDTFTTELRFGPGLSIASVPGEGACAKQVHNPIFMSMCDFPGQTEKYNVDCVTGQVPENWLCYSPSGCPPIEDSCGPYCNRKPASYITDLHAGRGIGFDSCGDCSLIIFNNFNINGFDAGCVAKQFVQVSDLQFGNDFAIQLGDGGTTTCGGEFDTWDGELAVKVAGFTNVSTWSCDYVCDIDVTKVGAYVTNVAFTCATLAGFTTCAGNRIVTSCGSGCSCA